jgi:hypothetical protein
MLESILVSFERMVETDSLYYYCTPIHFYKGKNMSKKEERTENYSSGENGGGRDNLYLFPFYLVTKAFVNLL